MRGKDLSENEDGFGKDGWLNWQVSYSERHWRAVYSIRKILFIHPVTVKIFKPGTGRKKLEYWFKRLKEAKEGV